MKLKYDFYVSDFAKEKVAIVVGDGLGKYDSYIRLDATAAEIFDMLKSHVTRQEIADRLSIENPDEDPAEIQNIVDDFLDRLKGAHLLEE